MNLHKNGQLIHNLRKANGFTQKQIADQLHICPKTVSKWENGRGFPDILSNNKRAVRRELLFYYFSVMETLALYVP